MKKILFAILSLLIIAGFVACTTPNRQAQVIQANQKSYIFFSGNAKEGTAYIDGKAFLLTEDTISDTTAGIRFHALTMIQ